MKKRMLSLLLTACMLLGLLPGAAAAAEITDATITTDTDLSSYTSPASWVTLTVPASTTVTLSGNVTLNKVHLVIGAGATVTLSGVKLLGKEYATSEFTENTPTVTGAATSTLILENDAAVKGSTGFQDADSSLKLAPAAAVSGVDTIIMSGCKITGGDLATQNTPGIAASAILNAAEVYAESGDILCGSVRTNVPTPGTAPAVAVTGSLTYYTSGATVEVTGTATRLYRLQATGATVSTAPAKDITAGEQTLKLYAAATQITATNSFSGGDWIVKNGSGTLVDTPALSGDSPTFAMPAHDLSIEGIAAVGAVEATGGEIKALESTALDAVLGSGNYTTELENSVTVIKLTQNLAVDGGIAFNGVTAIFDLNGHAIKGKPGVSYAGGIGIGGSGSDPATVVTLRATGGGSVTGKSSSGYGAVNLSAKNGDDKLTIEGGVYTGVDCAALAAGSPGAVVSLEITGGTFLGAAEEDGLYFAYGGVDGVITGGTFSSASLKTEAEYGEKWAISGGTFVDELTCGKYSGNAVSGLLVPGYTFQIDGVDATTDQLAGHTLTGRVTVVNAPPAPTADVSWTLIGGATGSGTLEEAFAAFSGSSTNGGGTITVNRDFTAAAPGGYNGFYLNNDRYTKETPIALNLNGKNVNLGSTGIRVRTGTLTVSGSGSLTTTGTALVVGYTGGTESKLILSGGDVTGDPAVEVQSGTTFEMSGGSLTSADSVALSVGVSGNAVITGGSVTAAASTSGIISLSTNAALTLGTNDGTVSTESPLLTASGDAYITTNIILGLDGSKVNYYDGKLVAGKDMMKPIYDGISSSALTLPENYILHTRRDAAYATTILETAGSNANLKELTLEEWNPGKVPVPLSPAFASGTTAYTAATALAGQRNLTFWLTAADDYIKKMEYKLGDGAFEQIGKFSNTNSYRADPLEKNVKDGENVFTFRVTAEDGAIKDYTVTVTVTPDPNVAQVTTSGNVTTKYERFYDALAAANAAPGSTLKLLKDAQHNDSAVTGSFTLDLNGKTLTSSVGVSGGALTVKSGATGGTLKSTSNAILLRSSGSLTLVSGTVTSEGTSTPTISTDNGCSFTMTGGTVTNTGKSFAVLVEQEATVHISGGTVTGSTSAEAGYGVVNYGGPLYLSGTPAITGGAASLALTDTTAAHIMAVDNSVPYSGNALTIYIHPTANPADGDVLVAAVQDAAHAAKFTLQDAADGVSTRYDEENDSIVLVVPPAKPVLTVEKYTDVDNMGIIALFANGRAVTTAEGDYINSRRYTKLYYTDDSTKTTIDLNALTKPSDVTFTGDTTQGYDLTNVWLYGGSNGKNVAGNTNIAVTGGMVGIVVGGGRGGDVSGTSAITVDSNAATTLNYYVGAANGGKIAGGASFTNASSAAYSIRGYVIDDGTSMPAKTDFTVKLGGNGRAGNAYNGRNDGGVRVSGQSDTKGVDIKSVQIDPAWDTNNPYAYILFNVTPGFKDGDVVATGAVGADADKYKATTLVDSEWQPTAIQNSTEIKNNTVVVNLGKAEPADPSEAQVTTSGGTVTKYDTFSAALAAAQTSAGSTLKLLKNVITDGSSIYITGSFTLDLGGKTLLCHMIVKGSGALTIDDSATGGSLVGNGSSIGTESKYALSVWDNGSLNIKGGTVIGGAKQGQYSRTPAISSMGDDVSITISGGTVRSYDGIGISADGTLTVSSGTVSADDTAISASGVLKISGGTISTTADAAAISIRDSGVLHLSNAPAITGGELANLTLMSADTCHIMASDGGTPYSGEKLTVFLSSENQKDGAVLVGGLTNADHAKKFEPKYINKGLTVQYNDANKNLLLVGSATPPAHVPVTDITGVPTAATAGEDLALSGTVAPANATNKAIVWSVKTAGDTGATITGSTLKTTAAGTVTVTATIANGQTAGTPFTKDFTITVAAKPVLHVHDGMTFEPYPKPLNDGVNNVYLKDDLIANLDITEGVILNLCLNGHSLTASHDLTGTILVEGTLNLYDCDGSHGSHTITVDNTQHTITGGLVTGGSPERGGGGGVSITAGGAMTLHGGTIAGNTVNNSAGGGVYVLGTFTMEGGAISYNTVTDGNGGGLCVGATTSLVDGSTTAVGTAILNGGTISHNAASGNGGGVRVVGAKLGDRYATLTLSGTAIVNNTAGAENGIHSGGQVILDADCGSQSITWQGTPITLNAPLTSASMITLSLDTPTAEQVMVTGATAGDLARIKLAEADAKKYRLVLEGTDIWLRQIPTYDVGGEVTDGTNALEDVTVILMRGKNEIDDTRTDAHGKYSFIGIPAGAYNVVATKDDKTVTRLVNVVNSDLTDQNLVMPTEDKNSKLEVIGDNTPDAVVGGLDDIAADTPLESGETSVTIKLTVESKAENDATNANDIKTLAGSQTVGDFLDLSLNKIVTEAGTGERIIPLTETGAKLLEIVLPYDFSGKKDVTVYRYHGEAQKLTKSDTRADGNFKLDEANGLITIYAAKFSTYAVAYNLDGPTPPPADTGSSVTTYAITATAGEGGSISPKGTLRVTRNADKSFTITPDEGYEVADVLVDGMSVGKVSTYTFEKVTAKHTIEATFRRTVKNPFTDVKEDDWFYDAVTDLYEKGLMNGTAADSFSPLMNTDRATIVTILWRMEGMPTAGESTAFPDVPAVAWYAKAVAWAAEKEIVKGYDTGKFGPTDPITREQLATILWRYAGSPVVLDYEGTGRFTDTEAISPWAAKAVTWALSEGILTGRGDGILDPTGKAARAEAAAMVERFMKKR